MSPNWLCQLGDILSLRGSRLSEIDEMRRKTRNLQKQAKKRVADFESKGVKGVGNYMPKSGDLNRLNRKQLESLSNKLRQFNVARFVVLGNGDAVLKANWDKMKEYEGKYLALEKETFSKIKNKEMPSGETIQERQGRMIIGERWGIRAKNKRPFSATNLKPGDVTSVESFERLLEMQRKRSTKAARDRERIADKRHLERVLSVANREDLAKDIRKLSAAQLDKAWRYTDLPKHVFAMYHMSKILDNRAKEQSPEENVYENNIVDAKEIISWALKKL